MTTTLRLDPIDPADVDFVVFDFYDTSLRQGPCLAAGDTIITAAISTSVLTAPLDGSTAAALSTTGAVIGGTTAAPLTRVTTQVNPGGTVGAVYLVTCTITTADGRTLERSAQLPVTSL